MGMMIDMTTALVSMAGTLAPLVGGGALLFLRQNRRIKDAEARLAEVNVDKAKVETRADNWHIWREQNETIVALNKALIERNKELVASMREKEDSHQADIRDWKEIVAQLSEARRERDYYFQWRCYREHGDRPQDCKRRKPKQKVPLRYVPLNATKPEEPIPAPDNADEILPATNFDDSKCKEYDC